MDEHKLNVRLRLVVIKNGKLLTEYNSKKDFCFYIGGHLEYGETVLEGCEREITEECGERTFFNFRRFCILGISLTRIMVSKTLNFLFWEI